MTEVATHINIPLVLLVSSFIVGLLGLAGWVLNIERRKVEKQDFESFAGRIDSRLSTLHAEVMAELRDMRQSVRHVDDCPYLDDKRRVVD